MRRVIKFFLLLLCLSIFSQNLVANEQDDLKKSFLNKIDDIIVIVQDKSLTTHQRNEKIVTLLKPTFDFELMAKLSLGKKAWKELTKEERVKFTNLYVKRMEDSYSAKLDAYSDEKIEIKDIKQPKKSRMFLVTDLVSDSEKLEIIYKFYKPKRHKENKDDWLIYDVEILGVSILKTDKAQFKEFLQTRDIHELMEVLAK